LRTLSSPYDLVIPVVMIMNFIKKPPAERRNSDIIRILISIIVMVRIVG
jgi:hypothetical protein